jgi:DNA-binding LytR/AlgR family response regulator
MFPILKQPFPAHSLSSSIRMAAVIGLFVACFLLLFQPFGLREIPAGTGKILPICGYGLVTFACISSCAILLSKLFPDWFNPGNWTVSKEIRITLFNFLLIGFFNTLYTFLIFRQPFSLSHLLYFELITLAVGIIPVSVIVLFRHNRLLHANLKLAQEMNAGLTPPLPQPAPKPTGIIPSAIPETPAPPKPGTFTFSSETGTDQVTIPKAALLFAVSADNYVELHFLENGAARKSLIRSSLTRIEEAVSSEPKLVRCHRAYLVNLAQVRNFSGNAQGLKLELNGTAERIPVSRKMVPEIKALLPG